MRCASVTHERACPGTPSREGFRRSGGQGAQGLAAGGEDARGWILRRGEESLAGLGEAAGAVEGEPLGEPGQVRGGRGPGYVHQLVHAHGQLPALHAQQIQLPGEHGAAGGPHRLLGGEDAGAVHLGGALQAGGEVHRVADDGVVLGRARADVAHHAGAGVQADAAVHPGHPSRLQFRGQLLHHRHQPQRREARPRRRVLLGQGRVPEAHDGVADELVERGTVLAEYRATCAPRSSTRRRPPSLSKDCTRLASRREGCCVWMVW